jgi:hypothetical protein
MEHLSFDIHTVISSYIDSSTYKKIVESCKTLYEYYKSDEIYYSINTHYNIFKMNQYHVSRLIGILEELKTTCDDMTICFKTDGIKIIVQDTKKRSVVCVELDTTNFVKFNCKKIYIAFSLINFLKIIKSFDKRPFIDFVFSKNKYVIRSMDTIIWQNEIHDPIGINLRFIFDCVVEGDGLYNYLIDQVQRMYILFTEKEEIKMDGSNSSFKLCAPGYRSEYNNTITFGDAVEQKRIRNTVILQNILLFERCEFVDNVKIYMKDSEICCFHYHFDGGEIKLLIAS